MTDRFNWRRAAGMIIVGGTLLSTGLFAFVMVQSRQAGPAPYSPHSPPLDTDAAAVTGHAGCYAVVASGNELHGREHVLELRADSLPGVAGFYVLGVPAPPRGAAVAAGGWTIQRDSVFIMWRDDHAGFSMTLAADGDGLRGHMLPAQWTRGRAGSAPGPGDGTRDDADGAYDGAAGDALGVTAVRRECDGDMVPARNVFERPAQRPRPANRPRVL